MVDGAWEVDCVLNDFVLAPRLALVGKGRWFVVRVKLPLFDLGRMELRSRDESP